MPEQFNKDSQVPNHLTPGGSFNPHHENGNVGQGPRMFDFGKNVRFKDTDDPDSGAPKPMTPEQQKAWERQMRGTAEEIIHAETEPKRLFYLYSQLEIIVDRTDDWTARMLKAQLELHVMRGSDELKDLMGEKTPKDETQKNLERALTITKDIDLLFDQYWSNYRYLSSSNGIYKTAFNPLPEFMPPSFFARIYGDLPGLLEGESEWLSMSDQIDMGIRAYIYLALQSDPRLEDEFKWFKGQGGFDKLFANGTDEQEWVRNLKLATLPNEYDDVADLYGKEPSELVDSDWKRLDKLRALNIFADAGNGGSMSKTKEAVIKLISAGKHQDRPAMEMQARIALGFAKQTFYIFGLAGMYGTKATFNEETGEIEEMAAEDYPWSDSSSPLMNPQDKDKYNENSSYYRGPLAWQWFMPEHLMVDFTRMLPIRGTEHPQSKSETRSMYELIAQGKTIGEIMEDEDHITEWGLRAYSIRFLFLLKEDTGAQLTMNGELTRGKNQSNIKDPKFLEDAEKAIHIACRDWIITEGKNEEWFKNHQSEVPAEVEKIVKTLIKRKLSLDNTLNKAIVESDIRNMIDKNKDKYKRKAENNLLKLYIRKEKNRWKAITWLSAMQNTIPPERETAIKVAIGCEFLDEKVLRLSTNIDFSNSKTESGRIHLRQQMQSFVNAAADSIN